MAAGRGHPHHRRKVEPDVPAAQPGGRPRAAAAAERRDPRDRASVGLADFGRPDGFVERQVRRWSAQWEASADAPVPALDALAGRLAASIPDLDWYRAFAHFKFAVITQGIKARTEAGVMGGQDFGDLTSAVADIAEAGLALAASHT